VPKEIIIGVHLETKQRHWHILRWKKLQNWIGKKQHILL